MSSRANFKDFDGQWVPIFAAGFHTDSEGRAHSIDRSFVDDAVANFNRAHHEAPIVIGHPETNAPAFGWTKELRANGAGQSAVLEARFGDVDPEFEKMVREGKFKKRSSSFYLDANGKPTLRHIGFLGAQPPAVKGLQDIRFAEGDAVTFDREFQISDFSEDETMALRDEDVKTVTERVVEAIKGMFSGKPSGEAASFSEADAKRLVADSLKSVEAKFSEELTALKNENAALKKSVNAQASSATHEQNVAFVEKLGNAKCPPAFRAMGVVEFMDELAQTGDRKVTVISFDEAKDGTKKEIKTESEPLTWFRKFLEAQGPFIEFGERFSILRATGTDAVTAVSPERKAELREQAGLPPGQK